MKKIGRKKKKALYKRLQKLDRKYEEIMEKSNAIALSVSFCILSSPSCSSSSVISLFFCAALNLSSASRRMLRSATFASSPVLETPLISSLRRSSVSGGKFRRICLPSFCGLMPRSETWIAFSMALSTEPSHGWMASVRGSGVEIAAT